jgi:hypothetical protein
LDSFLHAFVAYRIMLTHIIVASAERSFSKLKLIIINSYLRSTMFQQSEPLYFSLYLVGNLGTIPHDLLHPLSSGVFAFNWNQIMYHGIQVHVQSIPTTNWASSYGLFITIDGVEKIMRYSVGIAYWIHRKRAQAVTFHSICANTYL